MPFADYKHGLAHRRAYQKTEQGKARHLAANRAYRERNRQKLAAHNAVSKALRSGKLIKWPVCAVPECTNTKVEAHHADYSNKLGVTWLCDEHHKQCHA